MSEEWRQLASCRDHDPELFFPNLKPGASSSADPHVSAAAAVCQGCPVRQRCAIETANALPSHGVWAGVYVPKAGPARKTATEQLLQVAGDTPTNGLRQARLNERRRKAAEMAARGIPMVAIGARLGVDWRTVKADLKAVSA